MSIQQDIKKPSVFWLIGSNLLLLAMALIFNWKLYDVLILFWLEAVFIGVVNIMKMMKVPYYKNIGKGVLNKLPNNKNTGDIGKLAFIFLKIMLIQLFVIMYMGYIFVAGFAINRIFAYNLRQ